MENENRATQHTDGGQETTEFTRLAQTQTPSFLAEIWDFLGHTKKWWLAPIIVALLIIGVIVVLGGSAAAPLIYTLF